MFVFSHTPDCYFLPQALSKPYVAPDRALALEIEQAGLDFTNDETPDIATVIAVGAGYHAGFGFAPNTRQLIADALSLASLHGFSLAEDLQIIPANLQFGLDALRPKECGLHADLFVSCFVYHPRVARMTTAPHARQRISPLHHVAGIWSRAARAVGAKAIVVCSLEESGDELRACAFNGRDFRHLATHIAPASFEDTPVRLCREVLVRQRQFKPAPKGA